MVKDIQHKLGENVVDTATVENLLTELIRVASTLANLQNLAQCEEYSFDIDDIGLSLDSFDMIINNTLTQSFLIGEGTTLWNASIYYKSTSRSQNNKIVALLRQAGLVLIQTGAITRTDETVGIKLIALATKVGKAYIDCGMTEKADEVYRSMNEHEANVLASQDESDDLRKSKASTLTTFYASRAEVAWKLANTHIANLMMQHATADKYLIYCSMREVNYVCQVCLTIGYQLSKDNKISEAITWLKKCHDVAEFMKGKRCHETMLILTKSLNLLASCYLKKSIQDVSALHLAENAIATCLERDPGNLLAMSLKIKMLKQNGADFSGIEQAYKELMSPQQVAKDELKILLNAAHFIAELNPRVSLDGLDMLLEKTLADLGNMELVENTIVAKFHIMGNIGKKNDMENIMKSVEVTVGSARDYTFQKNNYSMPNDTMAKWRRKLRGMSGHSNEQSLELPQTVILMSVIQQEKNYELAKSWYTFAYKFIASSEVDNRNAAILQRKISLCDLERHAVSDAINAVTLAQKHEANSAANYYIMFNIALEINDVDNAIKHLHQMCNSNDFHTNMLTIAANEAYKRNNKEILIEVLREILLKRRENQDALGVDIMVLLRCLIRLTHKAIESAREDEQQALRQYLLGYFEIAITVIGLDASSSPLTDVMLTKQDLNELEWYYKTAWNIALEFCQNPASASIAIQLFGIAYKFLELYKEETVEILAWKRLCLFTCIAGRIFQSRDSIVMEEKESLLEKSLADIILYQKIRNVLQMRKQLNSETIVEPQQAESDVMLVFLFEFEAKLQLKRWNEIREMLDDARKYELNMPFKVYERMMELLIIDRECPSEILSATLQALLNSLSSQPHSEYTRFSRWFRMLLISALHQDKHVAHQYFVQATDILKNCPHQSYPEEEIQWMMVTAWNQGVDYYSARNFEEARKWCETAIMFCRSVENGSFYEQEMRELFVEIVDNCASSSLRLDFRI
ncbi:1586_t:CDS:10 [Paraglomus brasilianum]|uniref:1586_t:CDS:1 n=1 Tax=Paraglomus brasilianum TaxID=144538 RepID=A0A9N8WCG8_9GLOM|nr:1586_t:CDS:10 [Paraglomus brasilianum]